MKLKRLKDELTQARQENKRGRVSLYLNLTVYKRFQKACAAADVPASTAVEKLMEDFLRSN